MTATGISVAVQVIVDLRVRGGLNRTISVFVHHTSYKVTVHREQMSEEAI